MRASAHPNALRVQAALGPSYTVVEFDESTHTAQEAADAIGCQLAQIAKSILFRSASGRPVLVIASGVNRVDEKKIRALLGEKIERAAPDFVKEMTGFEVDPLSDCALQEQGGKGGKGGGKGGAGKGAKGGGKGGGL